MHEELLQKDIRAAQKEFGEEVVKPWVEKNKGHRWEKGQSGNPRGRGIEPVSPTEMLAKELGKDGAKALAKTLIRLAQAGDIRAIQYIYDRLEGKPRTSGEEKRDTEEPLVVVLKEVFSDRPKPIALPNYAELEDGLRESTST